MHPIAERTWAVDGFVARSVDVAPDCLDASHPTLPLTGVHSVSPCLVFLIWIEESLLT